MKQESISAIIDSIGYSQVDQIAFPSRKPEFSEIPKSIHPIVLSTLRKNYPNGLYGHQAAAIQACLNGNDICVATPTASGKSLIFMSLAAHELKRDPAARVLALYPARALIQDQLEKWKSLLEPIGLPCVQIDGSVRDLSLRKDLLKTGRLILMTPDVAHAWLMSHIHEKTVKDFLASLKMVILDEAHVYDGVFGTNISYFMRRLQSVTRIERYVSSTATIGEPDLFIKKITGRQPFVIAPKDDKGPSPEKRVTLVKPNGGDSFEKAASLIKAAADGDFGRFIAFADSRRMVEQLVVVVERNDSGRESNDDEADYELEQDASTNTLLGRILPYRAGYEDDDRAQIQKALSEGRLAGVVSTSAMELGIDIGEIELVLLLSTPPTMKSFWQRFGRAGRRNAGQCVIIDSKSIIPEKPGALTEYLNRPVEPAWLYLDNPYIQYSQALCAAQEYSDFGGDHYNKDPFQSLPEQFLDFLENEINPEQGIPDDLYPLKQRAQAGPHYEFPIRSGIEKNFDVKNNRSIGEQRLGTLTLAQALREGYPGAIYYYMAKPFRVTSLNYRTGEISVSPSKRWTTRPDARSMVFPKLSGGILVSRKSDHGFIVECGMQISERVSGFIEKRGRVQTSHTYGQGSIYSQKPITRFFETTGVCWYFSDKNVLSEAVAESILEAFCRTCGVQQRDIGYGMFHAKPSPFWSSECQGMCIYDNVHGSLRLTRQVLEKFDEIVQAACAQEAEKVDAAPSTMKSLYELASHFEMTQGFLFEGRADDQIGSDEWVSVIDDDQSAIHIETNDEVKVITHRFTPQGLVYELSPQKQGVRWLVKKSLIRPINGMTKIVQVNWITGERMQEG